MNDSNKEMNGQGAEPTSLQDLHARTLKYDPEAGELVASSLYGEIRLPAERAEAELIYSELTGRSPVELESRAVGQTPSFHLIDIEIKSPFF